MAKDTITNTSTLPSLDSKLGTQKFKLTGPFDRIDVNTLAEPDCKSAPQSKLLQKRMKFCFLKVKSEEKEFINPFQAIKDMKNLSCQNSPTSAKIRSPCTTEGSLSYIFVQPKSSHKSVKESLLNEFLNQQGVFQINLPVALNDYSFKY
ncbi:unnamed protein product [Moneuplotes crassus]|uniref:Uncharacterized protein n=1 Tax=Euplotes crassus TaxID=5936 RepID=A0AAD1U2D5_EUPCR|nr:unnamed protein product [Moneuplotes crassus]